MEIKKHERNKLFIRLILFKDGKRVLNIGKHRKARILHFIQVAPFEKAYLKVIYKTGFINDSYFYNIDELKRALKAFTEKSLINYIMEN